MRLEKHRKAIAWDWILQNCPSCILEANLPYLCCMWWGMINHLYSVHILLRLSNPDAFLIQTMHTCSVLLLFCSYSGLPRTKLFYASWMRICFTDVFCFFCFFSVRHDDETTVLGNAWTDFHETFTKRQWGNGVFNVVPKWRLGPQIIFWGLKTDIVRTGAAWWFFAGLKLTNRTYWCRRLANDSELV